MDIFWENPSHDSVRLSKLMDHSHQPPHFSYCLTSIDLIPPTSGVNPPLLQKGLIEVFPNSLTEGEVTMHRSVYLSDLGRAGYQREGSRGICIKECCS